MLFTFAGCQLFKSKTTTKDTTTTQITTTTNQATTTQQPVIIDAPTNVQISYDIVSWSPVSNAEEYLVIVNNSSSYRTEATSFDLAKLQLPDGSYTIAIKAVKGSTQSQPSTTVTYVLNRVERKAHLIERILPIFDPSYTPDMNVGYFDDPYEYANYLKILTIVETYVDVVVESKVNFNDSIEVVDILFNMFKVPPKDFTQLQTAINEVFAFGFTTNDLASLLVNIYYNLGNNQVASYDRLITKYESDLKFFDQQVQYFLNTLENSIIYNKISTYVSPYSAERIIYNLVSGKFDPNTIRSIFDNISFHILFNNGNMDNYEYLYYYENDDSELLRDIEEVLLETFYSAYVANDLDFIYNIYNLQDLWNAIHFGRQVYVLNKVLENNYMQKEVIETTLNLIDTDKDAVIAAVEVVVNYAVAIFNSFDADLVNSIIIAIDEGLANPNEIFIIKDELVHIFLNSLPTIEEFETFYRLINVLALMAFDVDNFLSEDFINDFATLTYYVSKLELQLLLEIDLETFATITDLVQNITTYECYEDEDDYYCYSKINPETVIDIILVVDSFLKDFALKYNADISQLEGILASDFEERILNVIYKFARYYIESLDESENIENLITELDILFADLPYYIDAIKLLIDLGYDSYEQFISTEGKILIDYYQLVDTLMNDGLYLEHIVNYINTLIKDLNIYYKAIIENLSEEELTILTKAISKYYKTSTLRFVTENLQEINALLDSIIENTTPYIVNVLNELIKIEGSVMDNLSEQGISFDLGTDPYLTLEDDVIIDVIKVLSLTFTEDQEESLLNALADFYTNVLTAEENKEVFGLDVIITQEEFLGIFIGNIVAIHEIASFDFNNLTPEQYEIYWNFLENLYFLRVN